MKPKCTCILNCHSSTILETLLYYSHSVIQSKPKKAFLPKINAFIYMLHAEVAPRSTVWKKPGKPLLKVAVRAPNVTNSINIFWKASYFRNQANAFADDNSIVDSFLRTECVRNCGLTHKSRNAHVSVTLSYYCKWKQNQCSTVK